MSFRGSNLAQNVIELCMPLLRIYAKQDERFKTKLFFQIKIDQTKGQDRKRSVKLRELSTLHLKHKNSIYFSMPNLTYCFKLINSMDEFRKYNCLVRFPFAIYLSIKYVGKEIKNVSYMQPSIHTRYYYIAFQLHYKFVYHLFINIKGTSPHTRQFNFMIKVDMRPIYALHQSLNL